jgi:hypothetical protein
LIRRQSAGFALGVQPLGQDVLVRGGSIVRHPARHAAQQRAVITVTDPLLSRDEMVFS